MTALQFIAKRRFNYFDTWFIWLLTSLSYTYGAWVWLAFIPIAFLSGLLEVAAETPETKKGNQPQ